MTATYIRKHQACRHDRAIASDASTRLTDQLDLSGASHPGNGKAGAFIGAHYALPLAFGKSCRQFSHLSVQSWREEEKCSPMTGTEIGVQTIKTRMQQFKRRGMENERGQTNFTEIRRLAACLCGCALSSRHHGRMRNEFLF